MSQIRYRPVQHLKMTVWTSVLWKIWIWLAKKWLEMDVKRPFRPVANLMHHPLLKNVKISFETSHYYEKVYMLLFTRIWNSTTNIAIIPRKQLMTLENGKKLSIIDYFKKEYNYQIENPDWPLIHCGDPKRTIYLPIELLDLERQVSLRYPRVQNKHVDLNKRRSLLILFQKF